jgi:hypothetical protein
VLKDAAVMPETKKPPEPNKPRFVTISHLASEVSVGYDTLYSFIRRWNEQNKLKPESQLKLFKLPTKGRTLHLTAADAEMVRAVFMNPEDYAQPVK